MVVISEGERTRRWERLREEMAAAGYEVLLIAGREGVVGRGYLRYLTDWHVWGGTGYLVFPLEGEPTLVLGSLSQAYWARRRGWVEDVRAGMLGPAAEAIGVLNARGVRGRLGVVGIGQRMSQDDLRAFAAALPTVELVDAADVLERVRVIKSAEEVAALTETSQIVAEAMRRFRDVLTPGKTEREVVAEAWKVAREAGVLDGIAHISHDAPAFVHPPTDRVIEPSDVIKLSMEMAGPTGYWVELAGVFSFREPSEEYRRLFGTVINAIDRVRALLQPGTSADALVAAVEAAYRDDGWTPTTRTIWDAHGIGLDVIEPPILLRGDPLRLQAGMAINVHPGLAYGDALLGLYVQDNYVVTEGGAHPLSGWEHRWHTLG